MPAHDTLSRPDMMPTNNHQKNLKGLKSKAHKMSPVKFIQPHSLMIVTPIVGFCNFYVLLRVTLCPF